MLLLAMVPLRQPPAADLAGMQVLMLSARAIRSPARHGLTTFAGPRRIIE
jgi:hypothetical protein